MIADIAIGGLIFLYAGWMLVRHIRKSTKGACASCSLSDGCSSCHANMKNQ
ncbi:FeoB-associated Cys-rich membrane protein [Anoxybacteroides tepidamans]|uniref:FeoB-associated Cys-rich membrane protein n=1 Tax=Anoxybacteroides tepidamans TaxID=265948 RepID=UPI000A01E2C3|nr:FeoB-associated Cys-rich membrane protein [Anoxybacillus tepidamans]